MPKLPLNFDKYVKRIPTHCAELPPVADVPFGHYGRSANDSWNLLVYLERNLREVNVYRASYDQHMGRLATMVLLSIIEAFERFLKELAAVCVEIGQLVLDDRLDVFAAKGNVIAAHFGADNLGHALCESLTWCDCDDANKRFRRILADPFDDGRFYVFPSAKQDPAALRGRRDLMDLIWQLRHTIAHNVGVVTPSDALKFRLLIKHEVASPRLLWPSRADVWYAKLFLDQTVDAINQAVGDRLAALLGAIHQADTSLFHAPQKAQQMANVFSTAITIAGETRTPQ